jgi:CRISPR-associated protein Cas1
MLNEYLYCPRLFYLEWVQAVFSESEDTLTGHLVHRNVDTERGTGVHGSETLAEVGRSVYLTAPSIHIAARMDLIEEKLGAVIPVDFKKGRAPDNPEGSWESDRVQVCAQGLVLRENGYRCDHGELYYAESQKRVTVKFTDELVQKTLDTVENALSASRSPRIPPPLVDSPKCIRCSLAGICLPDETLLLAAQGGAGPEDVRRLYPARNDALPVYVQQQGSVVKKKGDTLLIDPRDGTEKSVRLIDVSQVCLFGNVNITPAAVRMLAENSISICHLTYGGWFYAVTTGLTHKNVLLRSNQFKAAERSEDSLRLACAFVYGKIRNMRTVYKRNSSKPSPVILRKLSGLTRLSWEAKSYTSLLGYEGVASQLYFSKFQDMLKAKDELGKNAFSFKERNRRPPPDPVNALLSFGYALLLKDVYTSVTSVGLDPFMGYLHRPRYGKPALALDLMEEFRSLIGDSVVLSSINNREIRLDDFIKRGLRVALTEAGKRKFIEAYHRRLDSLVTHPLFGYKVSYGRIIEVQARLLGRVLSGEIPAYTPFCTR